MIKRQKIEAIAAKRRKDKREISLSGEKATNY